MVEPCCSLTTAEADGSLCPASSVAGKPVGWRTVSALASGRVPPKQEFRLCREPECDVVYYGSAGGVLTVSDLNVRPGFKGKSNGLVCYCFLHHRADIARQLRETGQTNVFRTIKEEVEAGNCACEVRNPSGRCCLGDVKRTLRNLKKEMEGTA